MPQEHYVLRCFSCETFQVHIVKKSNKWECKICGAKQSAKRNYGKGSGKDCRNQVMKLNELRVLKGNGSKLTKDDETLGEEVVVGESKDPELGREKSFSSKWTEYLEESIASGGSENEVEIDFPSEIVQTKKRRVKNSSKNSENSKRICRNFKKSSEPLSRVCSESNPFLVVDEETFGSNDKQNVCETQPQKQTNEKHSRETNSTLKHSKYDKYMYDNDATQPSINSNIFNSHLDDLDNVLDF